MNSDKAFAIYAFTLVGGVVSILTATIATGVASLPPAAFLLEHVALALAIRTAYKCFGGANPVVDFLEYTGWRTAREATSPAGAMPSVA
jgi:hypothetical protein